jgi:hypothetical protein
MTHEENSAEIKQAYQTHRAYEHTKFLIQEPNNDFKTVVDVMRDVVEKKPELFTGEYREFIEDFEKFYAEIYSLDGKVEDFHKFNKRVVEQFWKAITNEDGTLKIEETFFEPFGLY